MMHELTLDEAVKWYGQASINPQDVEAKWTLASAYRDRADALYDRRA